MRNFGHYESLGNIKYFIPDSLPPKNPSLILNAEISALYGEAMHELGKLNEMTNRLPDVKRFIKAYVIKEALLSSAIEGVHTTFLDVFTQPLLESKPKKDTQLVMNYTKALDVAVSMIKKEGLPISSRVILSAHETLMQLGHGDKADPGHYRKQAVRVGNLVPAPALQVPQLMSELERYINIDTTLPSLIKAGLVHVQFETIHPFLDGNGRLGRLLIVLMLVESGLLSEPILYPSYYFKKHSLEYYQQLDRIRTHADFEGWITFYLKVIRDSSIDAYKRAKDIEALRLELEQLVTTKEQSNKKIETKLRAVSILFACPIINVKEMSLQLGMSFNTANQVISDFIKLDFIVEQTQQKRGKLFKFKSYFDILEREYD